MTPMNYSFFHQESWRKALALCLIAVIAGFGLDSMMPASAAIAVSYGPITHIMTEIKNASNQTVTNQAVLAGTMIHDTALVQSATTTATSSPTAMGSVDFHWYNNTTCSGNPLGTQADVSLTGGAATSTAVGAMAPGMSYLVSYHGDSNYPATTADCESVMVTPTTTTSTLLTTEIRNDSNQNINNGTIVVGTPIHDLAILSATSTATTTAPTGTITFYMYNNEACKTPVTRTQANVAVVNGQATSKTIPAAIWWISYKAHYSGDMNYPAADSTCQVVNVTQPANRGEALVTTTIYNASSSTALIGTGVPIGTWVYDKVTVDPATMKATSTVPSGTVTFNFFNNNTCSGAPADVQHDVPLLNGQAQSSSRQLSLGHYSYLVVYNGDSQYRDKKASCEPVTATAISLERSKIERQIATQSLFRRMFHIKE